MLRTPKAITKAYVKLEKTPKLTTSLFVRHRAGTNPDHLEKEAVQRVIVRGASLDENNGRFSKNKTNQIQQNKPRTKFYHKPKMKQSRKDREKHPPWVPEVIPFPNIKQSLTQSVSSPDGG